MVSDKNFGKVTKMLNDLYGVRPEITDKKVLTFLEKMQMMNKEKKKKKGEETERTKK